MKYFDNWNELQKRIDENIKSRFFKEREIWWCYLGENIGNEICGKGEKFQRPVLILKAFSRRTCLVVPLTTSLNENKYRLKININDLEQKIILSQIKVIDAKRLINKIGKMNNQEFQYIKEEAKKLIF